MNSSAQTRPVIDQEIALARLGGNLELLKTLAVFFLEDAPDLMMQLCDARLANDCPTMARRAHSLKGLSSTFEAVPFQELVFEVESQARSGDTRLLEGMMSQLKIEFDRLTSSLQELI